MLKLSEKGRKAMALIIFYERRRDYEKAQSISDSLSNLTLEDLDKMLEEAREEKSDGH